ncbi:MAG: TlpA family protein disulfide reductase [Gammaproteobacteria bacterium]|nr:TlpA family protein disulfide reductase [Gammaproteobacteria bacterium]
MTGMLLVAAGAGFLLQRLTAPPPSTLRPLPPAAAPRPADPAPPTASGPTPRPPAAPGAASASGGLPDFTLPDLSGAPRRLSDWHGRTLVINFWATWCEPCRREIPLLETVRRENYSKNLEIIGIAVDHLDSVQKMVEDLKIDYPVLVGEKGGLAAVSAFGMDTVLPFTVFADPQGRIVTVKVGELHRDEATFILARLAEVAAGRLTVAAARGRIDDEIRRLATARAASAGPTHN